MGVQPPNSDAFTCALLNRVDCDPANEACPYYEICDDLLPRQCYITWRNESGRVSEIAKGCWGNKADGVGMQCDQAECLADQPIPPNPYVCCCNAPLCNERFSVHPRSGAVTGSSQNTEFTESNSFNQSRNVLTVCALTLVPILVFSLVLFISYYVYRRYKARQALRRNIYVNIDVSSLDRRPFIDSQELKLHELKVRGRFGEIWRGQSGNLDVAVKSFPIQDADSWLQEQKIYNSVGMHEHPNILRFLGACDAGHVLDKDYCIITEYQENGSLYDYLKGHILSLDKVMYIAVGMLRGLAFLHEENATIGKTCIVHRDFKSKNVLLKYDLTPCIGDFGLALHCAHGRAPEDAHDQVGTRRYMAPEVLEGATEFSAFALRQIDVYAAALVCWELLWRTHVDQGPVLEYKLPFEDDVGLHPALSDMITCVVQRRKRPPLRPQWRQHILIAQLCVTVEEMWDQEPEGRLTAAGALGRVESLGINGELAG